MLQKLHSQAELLKTSFNALSGEAKLGTCISLLGVFAFTYWWLFTPRYPKAPTLRVSKKPWIFGELEDAKLYVTNSIDLLQIGWEQYSKHGTNYLLNTPKGKIYIVAPRYMDEVRRAPETHVDNTIANSQLTQVAWTLHRRLAWDQFHFHTPISKSLTESLGPRLLDVVEEAKMSIKDYIGSEKDWTPKKMYPVGFEIVTRTANRLLFGEKLARDKEFQDLSVNYTNVLFGGAEMIRSWPNFVKPFIMWLRTDIYSAQAIARKHLYPVIDQRIKAEDAYNRAGRQAEWKKIKPDDAIQWVLDVAPPDQRKADITVYRMLHINIAAIHTSSITLLEAFYFLAIFPEFHDELRDEIVRVFRQEKKWTKQALTHLMKLDSFLTEALRFCPFTALKMQRYTVKDWTLSDGTVIPKGVYFWCNFTALSLDEDTYKDAHRFDPWRMYRKRQEPGQANQHQFVMTSDTNLTFGHGKKACPGRFFAANEIKILMALLITNYEIRCTNIRGVEEIRRGGWINITKNPINHPIVDFKPRDDQIPEDIRHLFLDI
ncbi:uncharacterized protein Z518_03520 [Rhinocladiella mackenziei CBS 650.93]|uniref:Cytochrome P450 monooxygenase n=1 Tax=Rhinocladiella mackenziei CBS 650.93 TaxID=1442369 RepID=A0A0D2HE68_9EURO|nr:uncharacterized protein Z518_03520 [Rhinocladiella mackenziei CBS 650.93]KIX08863.1 hypothetical protein Z518_03520 [Rhinocladiella mackenziei CBS 650.93]